MNDERNIFEFYKGEKIKFNNFINDKSNTNKKIILDEVDRFYPNIKELRKLQPKKTIKKNSDETIIRKLEIKKNKKRLLKSASNSMILNYITKKKEEFNDYYNKKHNLKESSLQNLSEKRERNIKERNRNLYFYLSKSISKSHSKNRSKRKFNQSVDFKIPNINISKVENLSKIYKFLRMKNISKDYMTIKSNLHASNIIMNIRQKKVPKIFEKINDISRSSRVIYNNLNFKIKEIRFDNRGNPLFMTREEKRQNIIKKMNEIENFIDYKKLNNSIL